MSAIAQRIGRYELLDLIGTGGAGRVYRARDEELGRLVAVKVMLPELAAPGAEWQTWKTRMLFEARATAALNHPNVVSIYDVGEVDGLPYLVMELIVGHPLTVFMGDQSVPWPRRLRWLADVARSLRAAHGAGLVHRDVKPANVLIADDGVVKVVDFGFARALDAGAAKPQPGAARARLTIEGSVVGTPRYMAPERFRAEPLDHRSDQFSWGVVAYELLGGVPPWDAENPPLLVARMLSTEPPPLSAHNPQLPPQVVEAVERTLRKRPEERFPDMNTLVNELRPWCEPPPSVTRQMAAITVPPAAKIPALTDALADDLSPPAPPARSLLVPAVLVALAAVIVGILAWVLVR